MRKCGSSFEVVNSEGMKDLENSTSRTKCPGNFCGHVLLFHPAGVTNGWDQVSRVQANSGKSVVEMFLRFFGNWPARGGKYHEFEEYVGTMRLAPEIYNIFRQYSK